MIHIQLNFDLLYPASFDQLRAPRLFQGNAVVDLEKFPHRLAQDLELELHRVFPQASGAGGASLWTSLVGRQLIIHEPTAITVEPPGFHPLRPLLAYPGPP